MKNLATIFSDAEYVLRSQGLDAATDYLMAQAVKLNIDKFEMLRLYVEWTKSN